MYMYVPCLNFQNRYFAEDGHVLCNIEPIFMLFVIISSRPCVACRNFTLTGPQYASMLLLLLYSKGKNI